jgi:hypothetical protein
MIPNRDRRIFRRLSGREASRYAGDRVRVVAGVEKWHRIALAAGCVDNAMHGRAIAIVGPARDHVAEIDDVGVRQRIGMDPSGRRLIPDLQTADIVLPQERQATEIGVRARALLPGLRLRGLRWKCNRLVMYLTI